MTRIHAPRLPDWEDRLNAFLDDAQTSTFCFGTRDCALFGADAALAQTGVDQLKIFRGKYVDAKGAAAALRKYGAGTITRTFDTLWQRIPPAMAKRGDLVMIKDPESRLGCIGVAIGSGQALFLSDGLERRPRSEWLRAWAVG